MGKQGKWGRGKQQGWNSPADSSAWHGYSGSGYDKQTAPRQWYQEASDASHFPHFDSMVTNDAGRRPPAVNMLAAENAQDAGGLVKFVQKSVNNIRRAEQKLRKRSQEQKKTAEQWELFQTRRS